MLKGGNMNLKNIKKIICTVLAASLCLSASGCGKDSVVVDDYAGETEITESADESTSTDELNISSNNQGTLQDLYGNVAVLQEDFTVDNTSFSTNARFTVPNQDHLNVYNMKYLDDGKADEEAIVKSLFGDTGKKIESLKYTNQYDYIPLLYKYRTILSNREIYDRHEGDVVVHTVDPFDRSLINASSDISYEWMDGPDMYIHMYEGDYNSCRFSLLMAYDYKAKLRYIFFEPVSIKEYFPDYAFETLLVARSHNTAGEPLDISNNCTENLDVIKDNAKSFLEDNLMLKDKFSITDDPELYKAFQPDNLADVAGPYAISNLSSNIDRGPSMLLFSDTDYISTIKTYLDSEMVSYSILSEQRDLLAEYNSEHPNAQKGIYDFIFSSVADAEITDYTADGYSVYLDQTYDFTNDSENADSIQLYESSYGAIKYTSNGLYSVDLVLTCEVIDVVENVNLLDFDKITECLMAELPEKIDLSKLDDPSEMKINDMYLSYNEYHENDDDTSFSYIPTWEFFATTNETNAQGALIALNAMDGTIYNIQYFTYEF